MKMKSLLAAALLATAPVAIATAPVLAADAKIEVSLPYEEFRLDNGLRVIIHEDRKAPIVAVQVMYAVGSKDEPMGKTGFAHLFEHLMFNGSENSDMDFFEPLKQMGATQYNGTTNRDRTNYFETVPKGALEQALFLESDRMGHLLGAVTQEKLDNQRGVVQNEKRLGEDRPLGRRIWAQLYSNLYPIGHPYHHQTIGSMKDLDNASLEDVQDWFKKYYGAANAVVVLAGDIDAAEARPLMEKYFGDIPSGPPLQKEMADAVPLTENKFGVYYDRIENPRLFRAYIGSPTAQPDSPLLDVMANALGGGKTSRLYRRLVDDLQIANSVAVWYSEGILSGEIMFNVEAKTQGDLDQINKVIDEEIARFLKKGPTKDELARTKTTYLASTVRGLEQVGGFSGKAQALARGAVFADDPDYFAKENLDRLQAASVDSVKAAADRWLSHGYYELTVLPFGDYKVAAPGYDRADGLPPKGTPGDLTFPAYTEGTLSNGMKVIVAPRPTVPVVEIALQFDAGTATENVPVGKRDKGMPGIASMTTSLMDEGTKRMDAQALAEREEELGAEVSVYNNQDSSRAVLSALKINLSDSLDLFADILINPSFPQEEIEKLRKQTIDNLREEKASVNAMGRRALVSAIFGEDHAYGTEKSVNDTIASVESLTQDDFKAWRKAWLRPDNATIYVTGDITVEAIMPELERAFGRWSMAGAPAKKKIEKLSNPISPRVIVIDKPDTLQSVILAGRLIGPTGSDEDTAISAMNDVFGGSFLSRINMNLREDKGWSYGVRSGAGNAVGQRLATISAPVQGDRTGDSIAELVKEMKAFLSDAPPTQAELDRTVAGVVGALPGQYETANDVLFSMMSNATYGRPLDYTTTAAARYRALTPEALEAAAKEVLNPDELTWVIVGDWSKIEDQVRAQNLGPIEVRSYAE
ncbi:MAG: M16 family metallopeptidase [Parvularcula sp.]